MSRNSGYIFKKVIFIFLLAFVLYGCSLFQSVTKEDERLPEELMSEGLSEFEDGNYSKAADAFQKLKDRYPYSKLAIEAELKFADSLFKNKAFEDALEVYNEFERLHPANKFIPYVIYQQGMCHFLNMNKIDQDQTPTNNALKEFERLVKEFPDDRFSLKARRNIRICLSNLAEYEFYVGRFYFKSGHYSAALKRFEYLIAEYPDLGQYDKALVYIARCKEKLADQNSLQ
jgi:outer membrane protein assembly factor BamD